MLLEGGCTIPAEFPHPQRPSNKEKGSMQALISNSRRCAAGCRCRSSLFPRKYRPFLFDSLLWCCFPPQSGTPGANADTLPRWAHGWCEDPPRETDSHAGAWPASSAAVSPVRGAGGTGHPPPAATPQRWRTRGRSHSRNTAVRFAGGGTAARALPGGGGLPPLPSSVEAARPIINDLRPSPAPTHHVLRGDD